MKHNVLGFQQTKLIENGLSVEDAFVLRVIKDMYSSATMEFKDFDGIKFMWINYSYLLEQIPIIGSKRNLMRKIELFGKEYLLLRTLEKSRKGKKGNFSYVSPTAKLDELQDYDLMTESHKGYDKNAQGLGQNRISLMTESHNKDTSIKDTSIKDMLFAQFWSAYPKKKSKGDAEKAFAKLKVDEQFMEVILTAIERASKSADWKKENGKYIPYPASWLNAKCWTDDEKTDKPIRPPLTIVVEDRG